MKTHLVFATMTVLLLIFVIGQSGKTVLSFDTVIAQAERLADEPYQPPRSTAAEVLQKMGYDQFRGIRWRKSNNLWGKDGLRFQAEFFIAAHLHHEPVTIYQVNQNGAGPIRYSPEFFDFGETGITEEIAEGAGYGGWRMHYPINRADTLDEIFVFQGASYFRAVAREQQYGISARGVAIDTLGKEEFPRFSAFWLIKPAGGADTVTVFALLEGKAITGAYEFVIRPGDDVRMEVRAVLFPRRELDGLGLAPLTSMFWYGENTSNTFGDFRPEVHDSDGLQIARSNGEWLWRPLSWSKQTQVNTFADVNPRGFGLLQRDRDFTHYQDLEAKYHLRPSVWVEMVGDWGAGAVQLLQLATKHEYMDNVVAWWQPAEPVPKGERLDLRYVLRWFSDDPDLPPLGRCLATRIDYQEAPYYRRFVLEFGGGELERLKADARVQADLWMGEPGEVSDLSVQKSDYDNSWRVSFIASSDQMNQPIELRCSLRHEDQILTETWTYTWSQ